MAKLFISYSRVDNQNDFVKQFVDSIHHVRRNDVIWWDEALRGGDVWWDEILKAIADCDIFVYLLSNESISSPYCQAEYAEAKRLNKLILTIQVRGRTDIPPELSEIQYVDMTAGTNDGKAIKDLFAALDSLSAAIPKRKPKPLYPIPTSKPVIPTKTQETASERSPLYAPTAPLVTTSFPVQSVSLITRFLASPIWQGVGGIAAIAAIILTIILAQNNTPQPKPTPSPTQALILVTDAAFVTPPILTPTDLPDGSATQNVEVSQTASFVTEQAATSAALNVSDTPTLTRTLPPTSTDTKTPPTPTFTNTPLPPTATATLTATATPVPPTKTPTPQPTATPTPTLTNTPTATATLTVTPTSVPTMTSTASPTNTPTAILVFSVGQSNHDWTPDIQPINGVSMVLVPPGCFMMGSTNGDKDEQPVHQVCFKQAFWIDQYEVMNAQFRQLGGSAVSPSAWDGDDQPRARISWQEAQDFCAIRGGSLPTEAEWEYAARGPEGLAYPWGNDFIPDNVVWRVNSSDQAANVGSRTAGKSWVGALDLSGNVWEWVADWYGNYSPNSQSNPTGANIGSYRVIRGGGYDSYPEQTDDLRGARRGRVAPKTQYPNVGFRCVRKSSTG